MSDDGKPSPPDNFQEKGWLPFWVSFTFAPLFAAGGVLGSIKNPATTDGIWWQALFGIGIALILTADGFQNFASYREWKKKYKK